MAGKSATEVINSSLEAAKKGLDLYNKVVDGAILWKTFEDTIKELDRYNGDYSERSRNLRGEVKTSLTKALSHYYDSTQSIYEWCDLTRKLLADYVKLYVDYKPESSKSQKAIILAVLEQGIAKMSAAKELLLKSMLSFNDAAGKLDELKNNLNSDFASSSDYYQSELSKMRAQAYGGASVGWIFGPLGAAIAYAIAAGVTEGKLVKELDERFGTTKNFHNQLLEKVERASGDIGKTNERLEEEKKVIGEMKNQTSDVDLFVSSDNIEYFRENTAPVAENLIKDCEAFLVRHGKKNL